MHSKHLKNGNMKKSLIYILAMISAGVAAQENLGYQTPSKEILELVDVPLAPSVRMDNHKEYMVFLYRDAFKTIAELSKEELRLGGLRIDPATNIGSRTRYYNHIEIRNMSDGTTNTRAVSGLPEAPMMANFSWSPDQKKMAFTQTTDAGVEVWVLDIPMATVRKLTDARVNANMGDVINWFEDSEAILVKMISADRKKLIDTKKAVPTGPTISVADGKRPRTGPTRTCCRIPTTNTISNNWPFQKSTRCIWTAAVNPGWAVPCIRGFHFPRTGTMSWSAPWKNPSPTWCPITAFLL
jgi:hypothetical protein